MLRDSLVAGTLHGYAGSMRCWVYRRVGGPVLLCILGCTYCPSKTTGMDSRLRHTGLDEVGYKQKTPCSRAVRFYTDASLGQFFAIVLDGPQQCMRSSFPMSIISHEHPHLRATRAGGIGLGEPLALSSFTPPTRSPAPGAPSPGCSSRGVKVGTDSKDALYPKLLPKLLLPKAETAPSRPPALFSTPPPPAALFESLKNRFAENGTRLLIPSMATVSARTYTRREGETVGVGVVSRQILILV